MASKRHKPEEIVFAGAPDFEAADPIFMPTSNFNQLQAKSRWRPRLRS